MHRKLKIYSSACLLLLLGTSCVSTKIHGVQAEAAGSKLGSFKKVESCTPTLRWKRSGESDVTYDVALYKSLGDPGRGDVPPERGEQVFYRESIVEPQVTLTPELAPKTAYLWSVRTRKPTGEVSAWSTYDKSINFGYYWSDTKNFWFGIKTPDCGQEATPLKSDRVKFPYDKKSRYSDGQIVQRLRSGEGALVLGAFAFGVKNKNADLSKYRNWEQVIQSETEPRKTRPNVSIYIICPDGREVELEPDKKTSLYMFVAPPGEYTLSRLTYGDDLGMRSARIFAKFHIDSGVLNYGGDFFQIHFKSVLGIYTVVKPIFEFEPDRFKQRVQNVLPQSLAYLREDRLIFPDKGQAD